MAPVTALVIAAHPDDETFGAGGTLARLAQEGTQVHVLIMTNCGSGTNARYFGEQDPATVRREEARRAAETLGTHPPVFEPFRELELERFGLPALADRIATVLHSVRPKLVLTHHWADAHQDHRFVSEATRIATRLYTIDWPCRVLAFQYPGDPLFSVQPGVQFRPNVFMEIAGGPLETKLKAVACYASELRPPPHPRSLPAVRVIAETAGVAAGFEAAEAFELLWEKS